MDIHSIIEQKIKPQIKQPLWEDWYIKEKIGSGSFSVVYRIEAHRPSGIDVSALKVEAIMADGQIFSDNSRKTTFLNNRKQMAINEVQIMKQLRDCPYIVRYEEEHMRELYVNGVLEGYYYLIRMEFLQNVFEMMKNRKFNYSETNVRKLAMEIGQGLSTVHKKGIIHRDVKPDNMFVNNAGIYKLGDFNISKKAASTKTYAGTEYYMAPEIYRARANVDASYTVQADIYSFGLCLYQMMNGGSLPFEEFLDPETAYDKRMQGSSIQPPKNASSAFSRIILKACAFDTANRYQTVDEILLELSKISEDPGRTVYAGFEQEAVQTTNAKRSVPTEYVGTDSRTSTVQKKRQIWIWFVVAVALVLLGIMGFLLLSKDNNQSNNTSIVDSNTSHEQTSESESQSVEVKTESTGQETQSTITVTQNETEPITTEEIIKTEFKLSEIEFLNSSQENGCFVEVSNQKDNVGNAYPYSIIQTDFADHYVDYEDFNEYYLNKKYNRFSGTIFLLEDKKTYSSEMQVVIYGDEQVLYSTSVTGGFLPEDFDLDISNVEKMKISITGGNINGIDTCVGIGDAVLRTPDHVEVSQSVTSEDTTPSAILHSSVKISEIDFLNSSQTSGCFISVSNQKDNIGNIYEYSIIQTDFADHYVDYEDFNEYYLNKKYNRFSGTIFLLEDKKTYSSEMQVVIYGDEQVLYSTSVTGGFLPEDFDLDISNVEIMKISITGGNINGIDTCIGIGNALLLTE